MSSSIDQSPSTTGDGQQPADLLRQSEERFHLLIDCMRDYAIVMLDSKGRVATWNSGAKHIIGYDVAEIVGQHFSLFYPPADLVRAKPRSDLDAAVRDGRCEDEGWRVRKDGAEFWANVIITPLRNPQDLVMGFAMITRDLTDRRRTDESLRASEEHLRAITQTAKEAIISANAAGRIVSWNEGAQRIFGYVRDEVIGQPLTILMPERYRPLHEQGLLRLQTTRIPHLIGNTVELHGLRKEGTEFPIELSLATWQTAQGDFYCGIIRDITQRKQLEEVQRKAIEAAQSASQAKSTFLANMSHEIRTPMNAVIGMTDLLLETQLTPAQREYLVIVRDSAESLLSLINDILDFSKIEAGKLELDRVTFALREVVGDTMKAVALRAHGRDVEVAWHVHSGVPDLLEGDPLRLRQILTNLVGNALKFTSHGEVLLDVAEDPAPEGLLQLHFTVRDTGIGIPPEKQQMIFRAFSQVDPSTTRRFGGTGLGLAIASRLVSLVGGRMWVESEVGVGSTFHFTAQFEPGKRLSSEIRPAMTSLADLPVLIVDDNRTNRLILEEMLANWQMKPTSVGNAEAALQELRRAKQSGSPYRVVLTDVHMPKVDGFQLTERIKESPNLDGTVILMLSSGDGPQDIDRCRRVGGQAHLMKPIKQSELFDAIAGSVRPPEPALQAAAESPANSRDTATLEVLLVEDSEPNQRLAIGVLSRLGHRVTAVNNGRAAVEAWSNGSFDLVLMDVQMPEMDGFSASRAIREREARVGGHIPIIAMTAHAMKGDREECLAAGMDGYLAKPMRKGDLERVIEQVLHASDAAVVAEEERADGGTTGLSVANWKHAQETACDDPQLLEQVLASFLQECPILVERAQHALRDADSEILRVTAHTLKGNLAIFGPTRAGALAERLEASAASQSAGDRSELLKTFLNAMDALLGDVRVHFWGDGQRRLAANR
jgi:PAS domain S-box-containing protein